MEKKKRYWIGTWPACCDFCEEDLADGEYFVDGRTKRGPWALMCPNCYIVNGVGFGLGSGQKYDSQTKEKIDG